jgi:homoserine acetyltransferase
MKTLSRKLFSSPGPLERLLDHLKVPSLRAIVGGSYGGMVALAFAERYPERAAALCIISAADRAHPMAIAWHSIQRHIVKFAIACAHPQEGLRLARAGGAVALSKRGGVRGPISRHTATRAR